VIYRKYWIPELATLVTLAFVATVPFWLSPIDLIVADWFYQLVDSDKAWALSDYWLWRFLFLLAPWLAAGVGLIGVTFLLLGVRRRQDKQLRVYGVYLLLSVIVGPGLIVNAIFKDHWDRPRPRDIQVFGGTEHYTPPLAIGAKGNSFPCGHCSVAFVLGSFYLVWRRRFPNRAYIVLAASIILGLVMGVARMAAGGHFLSDIIWSAILTWSALLFLYWIVLRIPWREDATR